MKYDILDGGNIHGPLPSGREIMPKNINFKINL